jgi:hypothetical protein
MTTSPNARTRAASALVAGGLAALALALAPSASADGSGTGVDPGAARNDIGQLRRVDPGAARNDIGSEPTIDVRRLLNDIDDPAIAPRREPVTPPQGVAPADTGLTSDDSNPYVGLAIGALAGLALGGGATAVVASRRSHAHPAGQTA